MRELFAVMDVYEKLPSGECEILNQRIEVNPETVSECTEDGIIIA